MSATDSAGVLARLESFQRFLVTGHVSPDGDCMGSVLGLAHWLGCRGAETTALLPEGVPPLYEFLVPHGVTVVTAVPPMDRTWCVLIVDTASPDRLSVPLPSLGEAGLRIVVDHHASNEGFADLHLVDETASSVGELLARLILEAGAPSLDGAAALCFMAAIVSDTQTFRYGASAETFRVVARLIEAGVHPYEVIGRLYAFRGKDHMRLQADVFATVRTYQGDRVAVMVLTDAMLSKHGACIGDTEGFIRSLTDMQGVDLAIFLRELPQGEGTRISCRSATGIRVDEMAARLGGGGHRSAAGARVAMGIEEAKKRVLELLDDFVR